MRTTFTLFFFAVTIIFNSFGQTEKFESRKLNSVRGLKIKLPKNYDPDSGLKHPLIVVFDADYLFGPVVGQTEFQTYFDQMPSSIIVGIVQGNERFYDSYFDEISGLPLETGARFYEFVAQELLPYIDSKYNTSKFRVAVGHNIMGNFINSFLLKEDPLFKAYINISPDFTGEMGSNVAQRLSYCKQDIFYYMATSKADITSIRKSIINTHVKIADIENDHLTYYFDDFTEQTHNGLVTAAVSKAMDKIFDIYQPLSEKELTEKVAKYDGTLDQYLINRYSRIEDLFGIEKKISEEEFEKVIAVAEKREDLESLQKIGKLALKQDPTSLLGTYYLALHAEKSGKPKKAAKLYDAALAMDPTSHIDKDFILSKVEGLNLATTDEEIDDEDIDDN
ncbi:hypothetical protein SAMN03097699_2893 [Flavobacteriaceae bacterium MAR_2010_188]|nr:hypothetical protein SAMN03097699_2893 [Flavobacteriaceae bacterium MAR_2010_188]